MVFRKFAVFIALLSLLSIFLTGCGVIRSTQERVEELKNTAQRIRDKVAYQTREAIKQAKEELKNQVKRELEKQVEEQLTPQKVFGISTLNLIYFGLDKNEQRVKTLGSFRTDSIVVFHMDFVNKRAGMFSIPRDTYVPIANRDFSDKINHAFPFGGGIKGGGFDNSIKTVSAFLGGVKIHRYFATDMSVIAPVVDAIGGVEYNVDVTYTKNGYNLRKGLQVLDGKTAEQYVRFRYTRNGDIDRVQRQQKFLLALLKEVSRKVKVEQALEIYKTVDEYTYTDLATKEMIALGTFLRDLELSDIDMYFVKGRFMNKNGISYWQPDMEFVDKTVAKLGLLD